MDEQDLRISSGQAIKRVVKRKRKRSNTKFLNTLLQFLDDGKHKNVLRYVNLDHTEFEVTRINKQNRRVWKKEDIALFIDLDFIIKTEHSRVKCDEKKVKERFRANMQKWYGKYIEKINERKKKCITVVRYKILERPQSYVGKSDRNDKKTVSNSCRKWNKKNKKGISLQEESRNENIDLQSAPQESKSRNIFYSDFEEKNNWSDDLYLSADFQTIDETTNTFCQSHQNVDMTIDTKCGNSTDFFYYGEEDDKLPMYKIDEESESNLKCDPFLCSAQEEGVEDISNPLGDNDDWFSTYQRLAETYTN